MRINYPLFISLLISCFFASTHLYSTHLRAGEIIVETTDCSNRIVRVTIVVYTDTEEGIIFGGRGTVLDFGDGNIIEDLPEVGHNINAFLNPDGSAFVLSRNDEDLGPLVAKTTLTVEHVYGTPGVYTISYTEPNRNRGVLNIDNSVETTFHIETRVSLDPSLSCNNSPILEIPPIDRACPGVAFFHNPGAFDPDGDSLAFEIVVPKRNVGATVNGYEDPNDPIFYSNFEQGNEQQNGRPIFEIDPRTGEITWDAPAGLIGEYNIAFIVTDYRFAFGRWRPQGFVRRDMQIIVQDCDNERPDLIIPEDICVEAGTVINETILGFDDNGDNVIIEAFSQVIGDDFGAVVTGNGDIQPSVPRAEVQFQWETECADVRDQPYQVVFKITDVPDDGPPRLVSFATWNITVIGPKPQVQEVVQEGQGLRLDWENYTCQNATELQVWRRVDSNPYTPEECEIGIRENAGYELIQTLPGSGTSTYLDEDVDAAAKYCYRLVAIFRRPPIISNAIESVVSDEVCFEFIPAEAPIITHVSVVRTDDTNGAISVTWREPFELTGLAPPYTFRVYRSVGFSGNNGEIQLPGEIITANTDSASLTIVDQGLNTRDNVYHYRVAVVDPTGPGGGDEIFSASASSVRLELTPEFAQIRLDWSADVPWSNQIIFPPGAEHIIYRGLEEDADQDFELLARVNVNQSGFAFLDTDDLRDDQVYCYRVLTKGTYGNPAIQSPLFNFSQRACAQPSDTIPPCAPVLSLEITDCEEFVSTNTCAFNDFRNVLNWSTEFFGDCQNDVQVYQVFFAPTSESEFTMIAEVSDTTFIHEDLLSFKGCYRVKAIDRSGNESEFSETFCNDNCPYYELPNVFTPNGDQCNEFFSAYSDTNFIGEDGGVSNVCGIVDATKCARFVLSVNFTVFNRWGRPVYQYQGRAGSETAVPGLRPELINWDGRGDNGNEVSVGVYYYLAEVTFDTVDPANATQEIKGWIQVFR